MSANTSNKTLAEIRLRIEPELKKNAVAVLGHLGLDLNQAIQSFLQKVVEVNGLPFETERPNARTRAAMAEAELRLGMSFENAESLFDALRVVPLKEGRIDRSK